MKKLQKKRNISHTRQFVVGHLIILCSKLQQLSIVFVYIYCDKDDINMKWDEYRKYKGQKLSHNFGLNAVCKLANKKMYFSRETKALWSAVYWFVFVAA